MTEIKKMTDQELAARMVGYIERIQKLMDDISPMLQKMPSRDESYKVDLIRDEYIRLKQEIKDDAHYLDLGRNERDDPGAGIYNGFFDPSIREASAEGFMAPSNSRIDYKFYDSLATAKYKLTKYYDLTEWKGLLEG
ncbi:hypothetical protein [Faecalispora jeddahensis]|uniref:hypothetical protein n=1 Tax=Faecalispora jeddahensis TaxID=1414721 RepID=UPI00189AB067|nr:hypothetical protein [Faecalispora jeddahensis]